MKAAKTLTQQAGYALEFEILGLPKTTNSYAGMKWQAKYAHIKKWKDLVFAFTARNKPLAPLQKAKLTLTRHSSQEPDFDGLVSSFKCIIDALVESGVIVNDKSSNIGQPTYLWKKAKKSEGKIGIQIEEVT